MKWKVFTAELLKCGFMEEYENVEKSQRFALTRTSVLGVPTNTPSYALLLETGKLPVSCIPFFLHVSYIIKTLQLVSYI